jgi:4-amino-4-deoxy-L-arabinose transferase-like glycosyltransferase
MSTHHQRTTGQFLARIAPPVLLCILLLYAAAAGLQRWGRIQADAEPLNSDVPVFISIARTMHRFYDSSFIEPLYILILKIFLALPMAAGDAARVQSLFLTLVLIFSIYFLWSRVYPVSVALFTAFLVGFNPVVIYYSVSGMRAPLITLLAVLFTFTLFHSRAGRMQGVKIGLAGAALALTRLSSLTVIPLLLGYAVLRAALRRDGSWKRTARHLALALFMVLLFTLPFLIHCHREFGDAFYNMKQYTAFWANIEYKGERSFPTLADTRNNPGSGPMLTPYGYIVGLHGFAGTARRMLSNVGLAFTYYLGHILRNTPGLLYVGYLGLLVMLALKRDGPIAALFAFLLPNVFILNLNPLADQGIRGVEMRFVLPILPFFALAVSHGLLALLKAVDRRDALGELEGRAGEGPRGGTAA